MRITKGSVGAALLLSAGLHFAAVAWTVSGKPAIEVEGGGSVEHAVLGSSAFNTVVAGSVAGTVEPEVVHETKRTEREATAVLEPVPQNPQPVPADSTQLSEPLRAVPVQPTQNAVALPAAETELDAANAAAAPPAETLEAETQVAKDAAPERVEAEAIKTETQEPVSEVVVAEAVETVGIPRKRPAELPLKKAESKPAETRKTQERKTEARADSNGAGGQGSRSAQQGGSQRETAGKQAGNSDVTNYPAKVQRKLNRYVRAPRRSGRRQMDVVVAFTISTSGWVDAVRVVRSSGSSQHDQAALDAVRRAAPFPKIPASANRSSWKFTLPIRFR
ncbi:protein TonB [Roseibium hamelinense]|uniref:Protein TonB n=1 Tax=Roseibium hamelinense TaxID=150831 RepID=A0A562T913_9HYPH|nr:energy transducer TonB [Roseibium hamelinense]MTI45528.1 energy transducer TonB [Roseibium hamelinense]TWI90097.1 protein TonB [Roseibium hamelinense]